MPRAKNVETLWSSLVKIQENSAKSIPIFLIMALQQLITHRILNLDHSLFGGLSGGCHGERGRG
jgi:hypothetical protein